MIQKFIARTLLVVAVTLLHYCTVAQDSSRVRISLLTCSPGYELYSTFGHSALRVIDSNSVSDLVFNYGTFNFNDDGFYVKFVRGQLLYCLSIERFDDFLFEYQMSNRGITEQVLSLSIPEKTMLQDALIENAKEENRYYKYDFFLDNCTTRLRDLIVKIKKPTPLLPSVMPVTYTFRNAIHQYLDQNNKHWSKLGIDLLLGAPCDAVMTSAQQQFLPDNLLLALDSTSNVQLVTSSKNLYTTSPQINTGNWFTPFICFSLLFILYVLLSLSGNKLIKTVLYMLDGLLFFTTGLLGILFIFMWTGTDHSMTKVNYNLLWAWPTNFILAFFVKSKKDWVKKYFLIYGAGMILVLCGWIFLPQQLNTALIPVVALLIFRSLAGAKNNSINKVSR